MGFTAKNFRTWAASSRCAERLAFLSRKQTEEEMKIWISSNPVVDSIEKIWSEGDWFPATTETAKNKVLLAIIDTVASDLGNTRAVCRSSYIHPYIIESYLNDELLEDWNSFNEMKAIPNLSKGESTTLRILKKLQAK